MIPELGHYSLALALAVAIVQGLIPLLGRVTGTPGWMLLAIPASRAQFLLVSVAYACLTYSFVTHDFSVAYVASNSNLHQPLMYRISGVWGAHEGSLLLWVLLLSLWGMAVSVFSRRLPAQFLSQVLSILGLVAVGLILFILFTSNPFDRLFPVPLDGRELNPLLQDPGLAFHPPLLYMGYVGLAVPFAFAIAALLDGKLDPAWVRWSRPWAVTSWVFLTFGIGLGSWWAYYELGWGGWWFWDPVENASFMPWLVATALIHSLAVAEQRGAFKSWTVLLAISGFTLSLLGTFLVRSGVLVSVHAFATDPARGVFILGFLGTVIGLSLALYAWRFPKLASDKEFNVVSRDMLLLVNNVLLTVASASILLGTLYPLILDALGVGKISVGPPYFEAVFVPLMVPLVFLMAVGPLSRWKRDQIPRIVGKLKLPLFIAFGIALAWLLVAYDRFSIGVLIGLFIATWVLLSIVVGIRDRIRSEGSRLFRLPAGYLGMQLAHFGIAVFVVGVTLVSAFSIEKDLRMLPGDSYDVAGHTFTFNGTHEVDGPNYAALRGEFIVSKAGTEVAILHPEKRRYASQPSAMTEAGIDSGFTRDLYAALGDPLDNDAWTVRLYHKPYVQWLWIGCLLMGFGGIVTIFDKRYRVAERRRTTVAQADTDDAAGGTEQPA